LQRLGDVVAADRVGTREVGDGPRQAQHAVVGTAAEAAAPR